MIVLGSGLKVGGRGAMGLYRSLVQVNLTVIGGSVIGGSVIGVIVFLLFICFYFGWVGEMGPKGGLTMDWCIFGV